MFAVERQKRILELLKEDGAVWVSRLAEELSVTEETVRRDLEKLENAEALVFQLQITTMSFRWKSEKILTLISKQSLLKRRQPTSLPVIQFSLMRLQQLFILQKS